MAALSVEADRQISDLELHYAQRLRFDAIEHLATAVATAPNAADHPLTRYRAYPATYSEMASLGMRWIKVHGYWFAYVRLPGGSVVTNVMYETSDIPARTQSHG